MLFCLCIVFMVASALAKVDVVSDELSFFSESEPHYRIRRQISSCNSGQWQCRDGSCIGFDGKCDGIVDCPDGSDETFPLCRQNECQTNWFRCAYGACVDGDAPCNGIKDCADNSDELLPRCRNERNENNGKFKCQNGDLIQAADLCDGVVNCADGSDETLRTCADKYCPDYVFRCAYGACVDKGADCNDKQECADGSDESDELCNRTSTTTVKPVITTTTTTTTKPVSQGKCTLPSYPSNGIYTVGGIINAVPGQTYPNVYLNVTCHPGYMAENQKELYCVDGIWSGAMPNCVRFCRLKNHESVDYRCLIKGLRGYRPCESLEPAGTVVKPVCRAPNYYYSGIIPYMYCDDFGNWDNIVQCKPECGTITPEGIQLIIGGRRAKRGELPWHAGIYSKTTTPYLQICGGSLISNSVVISAAHCFWDDVSKQQPAANYAVAVGKLYRPWNNPQDTDAQKSDVASIRIPPHFQGVATNFQDDIAVVTVTTPFTYQVYIRPVCIDFDVMFDFQQLVHGNMGKVAGWGLTDTNGKASQVLKVVDLPYVNIQECYAQSPPGFRAYITSDKICAGYTNGTSLCQGDSGGGLAFPAYELSTQRYYLRGIVSTAPKNEDLCNANTLTTFTHITRHEDFITFS